MHLLMTPMYCKEQYTIHQLVHLNWMKRPMSGSSKGKTSNLSGFSKRYGLGSVPSATFLQGPFAVAPISTMNSFEALKNW